MKKPTTPREKRAVNFGIELLTKYGYGYTIDKPAVELMKDLRKQGAKICHVTIINYWKTLERLGYVKKYMPARMFGASYKLNRYAFSKLINSAQ